MDRGKPIIEFRDFSFQYNAQMEPTLYDINLTIRKGEKVLIAGPSGCGKSTLVNCINGLIPFSYKGEIKGSLKINGMESSSQSISRISNTVGTVLQDSDAQFIGMTVLEDIAFALENECVAKEEMIERARKAAEIVDISGHLGHPPTDLSGGQKQRTAIAGILVDDVEVMLFDEPLANLDPATGKTAMELIDGVAQKTGASVLVVEHRIEDVLHIEMDRIILMDNGRIVFDGTPDALLSSRMLIEGGIREPLYITALKYAGVEITEDKQPHSIRSIELTDEDRDRVRKWHESTPTVKPEPRTETILDIKDLIFAYEDREPTLKGVDLQVHRGELMAIVGRNGAGKSTLAKTICRFEKNCSGSMLILGEDLTTLSIKECADRVGYVMQNPNQMISKTMIFDEISLGLKLRGMAEDAIKEKVEDIMKICGLYEFRNWPISALSYGQKKRVTIASILALDPEIIILDEPTAGQDFRHYTDIMEFLKDINRRGITIIMITHDMHLMLEYAERAVVFTGGVIIADRTSAEILTSPDIIEMASLKETSLYHLALMCGIDEPSEFVQHFINYDREVRS
ncbi:MAG: ABC transporter ATP-binding protein [Clostridiales bacterium]|nr:ABC transporter ATP-binding protein [Clostridiales bacterium]